jgi:hypothetical protein
MSCLPLRHRGRPGACRPGGAHASAVTGRWVIAVCALRDGTRNGHNAPAATRRRRYGTRCVCPWRKRPRKASKGVRFSAREMHLRRPLRRSPSPWDGRGSWAADPAAVRGLPHVSHPHAVRRRRSTWYVHSALLFAHARAPVAPCAPHAALPGRLPCTHPEPARVSRGVRFRPCIDIHQGKVKQIVGSTLTDAGDRCGHARGCTLVQAPFGTRSAGQLLAPRAQVVLVCVAGGRRCPVPLSAQPSLAVDETLQPFWINHLTTSIHGVIHTTQAYA